MTHRGALLGALAALVLLFVYPPLGLLLLGIVVVTAIILMVTGADSSRPCPRCGRRVKTGVLDCPHCGFDFRSIGAEATKKNL